MTNQDLDKPENQPEVTPKAEPVVQAPKATEVAEPPAAPKGSKTPETQLYAALKEEREQKRALEERIKQLETSMSQGPVNEEVFSDEGKLLKGQVDSLKNELELMKEQRELETVYSLHPELKEVSAEFEEFRRGYPGVPLDKQANLFLVEKGIHPNLQSRKGLEKPSGGVKGPTTPEMTDDDLKRLREENPRKYLQLVQDGKI